MKAELEPGEFAEKNRALLGIPEGKPFELGRSLDVTKLYYHKVGSPGGRKPKVRECLFKVQWNEGGKTVGTTLAIDWNTRRVRALLTSDLAARR